MLAMGNFIFVYPQIKCTSIRMIVCYKLLNNCKRPNSGKLMAVLDEINQSGLGRVFLARQGMNSAWSMKRDHLSPAYTTRWADLPKVR